MFIVINITSSDDCGSYVITVVTVLSLNDWLCSYGDWFSQIFLNFWDFFFFVYWQNCWNCSVCALFHFCTFADVLSISWPLLEIFPHIACSSFASFPVSELETRGTWVIWICGNILPSIMCFSSQRTFRSATLTLNNKSFGSDDLNETLL